MDRYQGVLANQPSLFSEPLAQRPCVKKQGRWDLRSDIRGDALNSVVCGHALGSVVRAAVSWVV